MAKEKEGVDLDIQGGKEANQPELVEVDFNNEKVMVPKETADKFHEMEHNLKSGYDKKLVDERVVIQQERDKLQADFKADVADYNDLLGKGVTDLSGFSARTVGGDGQFHGAIPEPDGNIVEPTATPTTSAFTDDAFTKLSKELDSTNERLDLLDRRDAEQAVLIAESLIKSYPGSKAYFDAIKKTDMVEFHQLHGRAATQDEIKKMFSTRHAELKPFVKQDTDISTVPDVSGGGRPNVPKVERPRGFLEDTDAITQAALDSVKITQ